MGKLTEVLKSLLDLTVDELVTVREEAKDRLVKINRNSLAVGDTVFVTNDNNNELYVITKKNKVNYVIQNILSKRKYNCPPALLKIKEV